MKKVCTPEWFEEIRKVLSLCFGYRAIRNLDDEHIACFVFYFLKTLGVVEDPDDYFNS